MSVFPPAPARPDFAPDPYERYPKAYAPRLQGRTRRRYRKPACSFYSLCLAMPLLVSGRVSDNKLAEDHRSPPRRRGGQAGRGASYPPPPTENPNPKADVPTREPKRVTLSSAFVPIDTERKRRMNELNCP